MEGHISMDMATRIPSSASLQGLHLFALVDRWWYWIDSTVLAKLLPPLREAGVAPVIRCKFCANPSDPCFLLSSSEVEALKAAEHRGKIFVIRAIWSSNTTSPSVEVVADRNL